MLSTCILTRGLCCVVCEKGREREELSVGRGERRVEEGEWRESERE